MKKFLLALGVVAALSLLFVSCGDKPKDDPEPAGTTFDGNVDLTGKTVKNATAFAAAYDGGIVIDLDTTVNLSDYKTLKIGAKFYGADDAEIAANWGLGQYLLLADPAGAWSGDNLVATQYNLGMQDMDLSALSGKTAKAVAVQNSSADVKFIEVTSIKFEK